MAYIFAPDIRGGIKALKRGDAEPLAGAIEKRGAPAIIELGKILSSGGEQNNEAIEAVTRALRGKLKRAGRSPEENRERNQILFAEVAYWLGRGATGWQEVRQEKSAFYKAIKALEGSPGFRPIEPESLHRAWVRAKKNSPNFIETWLWTVERFGRGLDDSSATFEQRQERIDRAERAGLYPGQLDAFVSATGRSGLSYLLRGTQ